jgi:hypothetical protein
MSDFNNPDRFDKYGNPVPGSIPGSVYDPGESTGRAPYVLLGLLVLVGIIGGALYFNGGPNSARRGSDVATAPPAASDTVRTPSSPALPPAAPTRTAPATTPAPAGTSSDTMKQ